MTPRSASLAILLLAAGAALAAVPARGADGGPAPAVTPEAAASAGDNAAEYCRNIANAAADARYARQADALAAMEKELEDRIAKLEAKRSEYEEWVKRRQEMLDKADAAVVAIYSQMRPDAAANQISVMDAEAAAAILAKLTPRTASAILNEMDAATAAALTDVMAGLAAGAKAGGQPG